MQVAGLTELTTNVSPSAAEDVLYQLENRINSLETDIEDMNLKVNLDKLVSLKFIYFAGVQILIHLFSVQSTPWEDPTPRASATIFSAKLEDERELPVFQHITVSMRLIVTRV